MAEKTMKDLFIEAEIKGLWFHCGYQDLWFSPKQLAAEQEAGRFRWGPVNWMLRDPRERVAILRKQAATELAEAERLETMLTPRKD